jgi:hypothetical protein
MKDDLKFSNILFDRYKTFLSAFLRILTILSKSGEDWQDGESLRFVSKLEEFETKKRYKCFRWKI